MEKLFYSFLDKFDDPMFELAVRTGLKCIWGIILAVNIYYVHWLFNQ